MSNDPWTGARVGTNQDAPLGGSQQAETVWELGKTTIPHFDTSAARDAALAAWVAADDNNTATDGMKCTVKGLGLQILRGGVWYPVTSTLYRHVTGVGTGTLAASAASDFIPAQTIPANPFGPGVPFWIDVDAVIHAYAVPTNAGARVEILFDGVVQDGDSWTNTAPTCEHTWRARSGLTVSDSSSHTVKATITAGSGGILNFDGAYQRALLMIRPYVVF